MCRVELRRGAVLLIGLGLMAACGGTRPLVIAENAVDDLPAAASCPINVVLVDQRVSPHLGLIGGREFVYPDYLPYLERQIRQRFSGQSAQPAHRFELLQAYLETNRSTLSFNTVMRVHPPGETGAARVYRGDTTRISWGGGDGELGAYIERSTLKLLDQIANGEACGDAEATR